MGRGDRPRGPHRRLQLRRRRGRAPAPAALGDPAARRAPHALGPLPHRRQDPPRRRRHDLHAGARDLLDHRRTRSARCCRPRTPRRRRTRSLGVSDGTPGQTFPLRFSPVLKPTTGETLEVQDPESGRLGGLGAARPTSSSRPRSTATTRSTRWRARSSSARRSARPTAAGPSTARSRRRARSCASRATATAAAAAATSRAEAISVLRSTLVGVDTVSNPGPANGGVDAEALEHARQRAAMEIRSRYRAVTAEDFEFLAGEASPQVARAVCVPPQVDRRPGRAAPRAAADPGRPPDRLRRARPGRGR